MVAEIRLEAFQKFELEGVPPTARADNFRPVTLIIAKIKPTNLELRTIQNHQ